MQIGVLKEIMPGEKRVALLPSSVDHLVKKGLAVRVEKQLAGSLGVPDSDYMAAGATVADRADILAGSDVLVRVRRPPPEEIPRLKPGCLHVSFLDPFLDADLVRSLAQRRVDIISFEMMPRTTLSQKMDALSSQANLAGYAAVILAAQSADTVFPMMVTPAGTIFPMRVFVVGAGVAGLQAIATAKRLGARVEAYDTRPEVEEQVKSLGARFLKIDVGETGRTSEGYARELTAQQMEAQRRGLARACAAADVVITTAQVFGKRAPLIITAEMVADMRPGSIVVDMAVANGGNVEGSALDREVVVKGVRLIGFGNLPSRVALTASRMYANNVTNLLDRYWDPQAKRFNLDTDDDILSGCLVVHQGNIRNQRTD